MGFTTLPHPAMGTRRNMSKLTETLRARGIYNSYGFFGEHPYISWTQNGGRTVLPSWFGVHKRDQDLGGAWYHYGVKTFAGHSRDKVALADAQAWASKKFGIKEWARDPFGSWGDAGYIKQRIMELTRGNETQQKEAR